MHRRVPVPRQRRRKPLPAFRRRSARYCSYGFPRHELDLRRTDRGARRAARRADGGRERPSVARVRGRRVGRGQDPAAVRAGALGPGRRHPRDRRRLRRAGRGRAALRADRRRAAPARALRAPGLQGALRRRPLRARPDPPRPRRDPPRRRGDRPGAAVRRPARAAGAARGRGRPDGHDRGPALGRPLDARVPRLPREQPLQGARPGRDHLPPGRAAPPPPAAPAAGRARARRPPPARRAAPAHPRRARRAAQRHPRRAAGRGPAHRACSPAARATRCSPRSCSRRGRTAAGRFRRPCATR